MCLQFVSQMSLFLLNDKQEASATVGLLKEMLTISNRELEMPRTTFVYNHYSMVRFVEVFTIQWVIDTMIVHPHCHYLTYTFL